MSIYFPLEFLPTHYGDGTRIEEPTDEDLLLFAFEHGQREHLADENADESWSEREPDVACMAASWGIFDTAFWAGFYDGPCPPLHSIVPAVEPRRIA